MSIMELQERTEEYITTIVLLFRVVEEMFIIPN